MTNHIINNAANITKNSAQQAVAKETATTIKRNHPASFKAKVALEMIREIDTVNSICSRHSIHPTQAGIWKKIAITGLESAFSSSAANTLKSKDEMIEELYKQIGQLKVELDWLKKKLSV